MDFFFLLSGFVIAYAYSQRLDEGLPWREFMRLRLVRLYPMLAVGVLVGGIVFVGRQVLLHTGLVVEGVVVTGLALTILPVGYLFGIGSYPVDNPIWSLFFEFAANAAYASPLRRIGRVWIIALFVSAVVTLIAFSLLFGTVFSLGNFGPVSFLAGLARVAVPFSIGVGIWHMKVFTKFPSIPFPAVAIGLAVALCLHTPAHWLYDLAAVLVILPVLVCLGAKASVGATATRFCNIAGRLSYPLYIMHSSVIRTVDMAYKVSHIRMGPFGPMCLAILLSLAVSWGCLRLYDEPVRRWLGRTIPQPADALVVQAAKSG